MKRNICKLTALLLGLLFSVTLLAPTVLAADSPSVRLPVKITAGGPLPHPAETYTVRLTAEQTDNPMPDDQRGGSCDLQILGTGDAFFPSICFDKVGIYTYTIEQIPGKNPKCRYDDSVYTVRITVTNAEQGGFDITVAMREGDMQEKSDVAAFHNRYRRDPPPPAQPKPQIPTGSNVPTKPATPPGSMLPTGVSDHWALYLTGSVLLLLLSGWIIRLLRRKEDE